MKYKFKISRLLSVLLSVILVLAMLPVTAFAAGEPPTLVSAEVTSSGHVELTFNKAMAAPGIGAAGFVVTGYGGGNKNVATAQLVSGSPEKILLTLGSTINGGELPRLSYTPGTVAALDGGALAQIISVDITNTLPHPTLEAATLPEGTAGTPYDWTFTATGGTPPYYFYHETGSLPGGLILNQSGVLNGTPSNQGTFNFDIRVLDSNLAFERKAFTLKINPDAKLAAPSGLAWDTGTPGAITAVWTEVPNAHQYQVSLYKNGASSPLTQESVTSNSRDYTSLLRGYGPGAYTFTVRALANPISSYTDSDVSEPSPQYTFTPVCVITPVNQHYVTLEGALGAIVSGQAITLLQNIPSASGIMVSEKTIELSLNGKTLRINASGQNGIEVQSGGDLTISGGGQLDVNVTGAASHGLYVSGTLTIASPCTVNSANGIGVYAYSGDIILQNASVTGHGIGAQANYGSVKITGNVAATGGHGSHGVSAYSGGQAEITGSVSAGSIGVFVDGSGSRIIVKGDVTVNEAGSLGVYAFDSGEAKIDGVITTAAKYIQVGTTIKTASDKTLPTTETGYHTYTDGTSTVWVMDTAPPTGAAVWNYRSPLPTSNYMQNVKYLGGKYMAVGYNGTLITSDDGEAWQTVDVGTDVDLLGGIAYGSGKYVLVGYVSSSGYAARIYTSDNGLNWHETAAVPHHWFHDVVYGNGQFLAVGQAGKIAVSDDGENWDIIAVDPMDYTLQSVIYADGKYVATGGWKHTGIPYRGAILTSVDGVSWSVTYTHITSTMWDVTYGEGEGEGVFTAVGGRSDQAGSYTICTSADGTHWTSRSVTGVPTSTACFYSVDYDGSRFIAAGATTGTQPYSAYVATSENGTDWTYRGNSTVSSFRTVASNTSGSRYVAMGGTGNIYTSDDGGTSWTCRTLGATKTLRDVAWNGSGLYVTVGDGGTIQTSTDGETWTIQTSGTTQKLNKIEYLNGQFIAVGTNGTILTSTNGTSWTERTSGTIVELQDIAFGEGIYVTGGNAAARISNNGIDWTAPTGLIVLKTVAYGNGKFVALSQYGEAFNSDDGQTWNNVGRLYQYSEYPTDMIYADGKFIAVGGYGKIFLSSDNGISWTTVQSDLDDYLRAVAYGGGNLIAVAENKNIIASADGGTTWFLQPSGLTPNPYFSQEDNAELYGIVTGDNCFEAVGGNGLILQSEGLDISTDPDAHAVAYAKYKLRFYNIQGPGANNQGGIVLNMDLTTFGEKGTGISWASSKPEYIAADGTVTRPSFGTGDQVVYLTATISKGSVSDIKTFIVDVIEIPDTDAQTVANAKAALTFSVIGAANTDEDNIVSNLNLVTTMGNGTTVNWSGSIPEYITTGGAVTRPAQGTGDQTVTLTATISKGSASDTKTFTLTVKAEVDPAAQDALDVAAAIAALDFNTIKGGNIESESITSNLNLITSGINGTTISWASSKPAYITTGGAVTRPAQGASDEDVILIATVTKSMASQTKQFTVRVKTMPASPPPSSPTGSSNKTPPPSYKADVSGNGTSGTLPVSVNAGSNSATVTAGAQQGSSLTGGNPVIITMPSIPGVDSFTLEIPADYLSAPDGEGALTLTTNAGSVTMPSNMLTNMEGEKAKISISEGDTSKLASNVKAAIGDRPLVQLTLTLDGKQTDWNNPAAPVTVSIPYSPTAAELNDPEHIVIWYIDGAGNAVSVPSGRYDPATGTVTFTTTHFSYYAIAYVHKTFSDLNDVKWAKKAIEAMASKGITNGTGGNTFSPAAGITRADYMVMLIKSLGLTASFEQNFADVPSGVYYYEALGIARELGIATGSGDNRFLPKAKISRQDMMALTARALEISGKLKTGSDIAVLDQFSDKASISGYAADSLAALIKSGLITGSGNKLNPRGDTTRAEAAVFLYRIYNQ